MEYPMSNLYFLGIHTSPMKECCITILYHALDILQANTINVTYVQHTMERSGVIWSNIQQLSGILIGCIFYGMVYMLFKLCSQTSNVQHSSALIYRSITFNVCSQLPLSDFFFDALG